MRDADVVIVYDAATFAEKARIKAAKPSGIFSQRAHMIGIAEMNARVAPPLLLDEIDRRRLTSSSATRP